MRRIGIASLVGLVACAEVPGVPPLADQFAPAPPVTCQAATTPGAPPVLDNLGRLPFSHEGKYYAKLATAFVQAHGLSTELDERRLQPGWLLRDPRPAAFTRLATPIVFSPTGAYRNAYLHTAFDVARSDASFSDEVLAPVTGQAAVMDWWGNPGASAPPYQTVVLLWDEASHAVFHLMHLEVGERLRGAAGGVIRVAQGEVLGRLTKIEFDRPPEALEPMRHVHVSIIDVAGQRVLDPATRLPYIDTQRPSLVGAYLYGAPMQRTLSPGPVEVVVEAFDRDDHSNRNFEVAALAATVRGASGCVYYALPRCELTQLLTAIDEQATQRNDVALKMLDIRHARPQVGVGAWPDSDNDNRARTVRYVITQLGVVGGRCQVASSPLTVPAHEAYLEIEAHAWDAHGNAGSATFRLGR